MSNSAAVISVDKLNNWQARLDLGFSANAQRTLLSHRQRKGPLAVQRPFYPEGDVCHVYLLHPPGGVVGGDQLVINVELNEQCHSLITTPGATKFYRSGGETARQRQNLKLTQNACLEWFPQENIFFPGARVALTTRVDLTHSSRAAIWEINCFGRPSINESFTAGSIESRFEIWRDGIPLLLECLRVDERSQHFISTLQNKPVNATLILTQADINDLSTARSCIERSCQETQECTDSAATLLDDLLVIRYLGHSTEQVRKLFIAVWSELRQSIIGKDANVPRIWNT